MKFVMLFLSVVSASTALAMPPCDDCENLDAKGVYEKILALSNTPNLPPITVKDLQKNPVEGVATCVSKYRDDYTMYFMPTRIAAYTKEAGPFSSLIAHVDMLYHGPGPYNPILYDNLNFFDSYEEGRAAYIDFRGKFFYSGGTKTKGVSCTENQSGTISITFERTVNDRKGIEFFVVQRAPSHGSVIFSRQASNSTATYPKSLCIL